jgi:hypothetical protein
VLAAESVPVFAATWCALFEAHRCISSRISIAGCSGAIPYPTLGIDEAPSLAPTIPTTDDATAFIVVVVVEETEPDFPAAKLADAVAVPTSSISFASPPIEIECIGESSFNGEPEDVVASVASVDVMVALLVMLHTLDECD